MADTNTDAKRTTGRALPVRLGLLVDSLTQPAWVERALQRIKQSGAGEFVLVVRNATPAAEHARSRVGSWWRNRRQLLYAAYQRLDRGRSTDSDPFASRDVSALLADVPMIDVVPRQSRISDVFEDSDLDRIRAAGTDVLIRLGFRILRGGILTAAPHGVWSYHHGDNERYRGGPPCFWEVIEGTSVTGTILQRLTESLDDGEVVYRSWGTTNQFSVTRNQSEIYWKASDFLARAIDRLYDRGSASEKEERVPSAYGHRLYVAPTNGEMAAGIARLVGRRVRQKWHELTSFEQWFMAYRRRPGLPDENREPDLIPFRFRPIVPPKDRFWADPFLLRVAGADFVIFEDYSYETARGVISALELGPNGPVGSAQTVLARDYHLSYPMLFAWRGTQFMVPESVDVRRVEIYRAVKPPYEWTLEAVVMDDVPLVDCTLVEIGGRWWMFANSAVPGASFWDELHLFHAPTPLGPWTPHRGNPVVSDSRVARPAGGLFQQGGSWYRPSQDCSSGYGGALNIQRILRLDESAYEEETVARIVPNWQPGLTGVHTVNALGSLTVIDVKRRASRLPRR